MQLCRFIFAVETLLVVGFALPIDPNDNSIALTTVTERRKSDSSPSVTDNPAEDEELNPTPLPVDPTNNSNALASDSKRPVPLTSTKNNSSSKAAEEEDILGAFCPWGICHLPGFIFGAFFRISNDTNDDFTTNLFRRKPFSVKMKKDIILVNPAPVHYTHEISYPTEQPVIYILPQKNTHTYKYQASNSTKKEETDEQDLALSSSNYNNNVNWDIVYLGGERDATPQPLFPTSSPAIDIRRKRQHRRKLSKETRKTIKEIDDRNDQMTMYSVSVSFSVSRN